MLDTKEAISDGSNDLGGLRIYYNKECDIENAIKLYDSRYRGESRP